MAKNAFLFFFFVHDFRIQLSVRRQDSVFEIVAANTAFADELYATVFLAVIKQQAVSIQAITAKFFDESIDSL